MKYILIFSLSLLSMSYSYGQQNNNPITYGQSFTQTYALSPGRLPILMENKNTVASCQMIGYIRYISNNGWAIISTLANSNDYVLVNTNNFAIDASAINKRVMVNGSLNKTNYTSEIASKFTQAQLSNPNTQNGYVMQSSGVQLF